MWREKKQQNVHACLHATDLPLSSLEIYIHKLHSEMGLEAFVNISRNALNNGNHTACSS